MISIDTIHLTTVQSSAVSILFLWYIWQGKPELLLGIYLPIMTWTRGIMIFDIVHTWILIAALTGASVIFILKYKASLYLPQRDRWIIGWLGIWCCWMILLIALYNPSDGMPILRGLLLQTLLPLPFILLICSKPQRIRSFIIAFLATSAIGCWVALAILDLSFINLRNDPTLLSYGVIRLNIINYHFIGIGLAITIILSVGLFLVSNSVYTRLLIFLTTAWCTYFLILSGSKQSMFGAMFVVLLLMSCLGLSKGVQRWQLALFASMLIIFAVILFKQAPYLILRSDDAIWGEAIGSSLLIRNELWTEGIHLFWRSPLWGLGFTEAVISHNLFISTLADQGLVGFVFLIGLLFFVVRQAWGIWRAPSSDENTTWRVVFAGLAIFCLIRAQVSSAAYSSWELYWAGAFLWSLRPAQTKATHAISFVPRRVIMQILPDSKAIL